MYFFVIGLEQTSMGTTQSYDSTTPTNLAQTHEPLLILNNAETRRTFATEFPDLCARTDTVAFPNAQILILNRPLMKEYGVAHINNILSTPQKCVATAYGGHQFGHYSTLGDGRAALYTELVAEPSKQHIDVCFKGSGRTAYSRPGTDGLATLSSVIREYIMSESMHGLGVPTTRALAAFKTGDTIMRQGEPQPGGVLIRTAESFIRFGTFELVARQHPHLLEKLLQYAEQRHTMSGMGKQDVFYRYIFETIDRYAQLVARWMSIGFIHGVMNTDNVSIGGLTIDYGPCAFMDEYHRDRVFSKIDKEGRYAFSNQPAVAEWNVGMFAKACQALLTNSKPVHPASARKYFATQYKRYYYGIMAEKLGLGESAHYDDVRRLTSKFHELMQANNLDFTNTFRELADQQTFAGNRRGGLLVKEWESQWKKVRDPNDESRQRRMQMACPVYIPRNHLVQEAIDQTLGGDCRMMRTLIDIMKYPYTRQKGAEYFTRLPTEEKRVKYTTCGT